MKFIVTAVYLMFVHLSNGQAYERLQLDLKLIFDKSDFCALCDIKISDNPLKEKYENFNFYKLNPIKVYWGSMRNSNLADEVYLKPISENQNRQVIIIYKSQKELRPGEWEKKFIPLINGVPPTYYTINGNDKLSKNDLQELIKRITPIKLIEYPTDGGK